MKRVVILGGGFTGLAAAHDLSSAGWDVTVIEKDAALGGLAGTFELRPGVRLEKFYHHWFTSDRHILDFIRELGMADRIRPHQSNTGLYYANSIFRLASPFDLLRFNPIPLVDRVRTGLMALYARALDNWRPLEELTAEEWLIRVGGRRAYEVIWKPLLIGKFGIEASNVSAVWMWNKLKLRGSSRGEQGQESLVYFEGGFGALTDGIHDALTKKGVKILTSTPAHEIVSTERDGQRTVTGVRTSAGTFDADAVLATVPLPVFLDITPGLPDALREQASSIRFLGNVCLVMRLKRSLSQTYWLNVADPHFPFVGVIEHTNLDDRSHYAGEHIAYLSKYLPTTDPLFTMSDEELFQYCVPFVQRIFPEFKADWVIKPHIWRATYSQPVITRHYSSLIPPHKLPISGLWLATMAQVYPEDRGTNYAIRDGRLVAQKMLND